MEVMQETLEVKSVKKPSKKLLKEWYDMTQDNLHAEVRMAIAEYFGHSIDETPDSPYGLRFVTALRWINDHHNKQGYLTYGLLTCRELITNFMLKRIGEVYGEDVRDSVNHCL